MAPTIAELAKMIDHSLLQPTLTDADMERGLDVAIEYNVASVCIKPYALKLAARSGSRARPLRQHGHRLPARRSSDAGQGLRERTGPRRWGDRARHGREHRQGAIGRLELRGG